MMARRAWIIAATGTMLVLLAVALHFASSEAESGARGGTARPAAPQGEPRSLPLAGADGPAVAALAPSGAAADAHGAQLDALAAQGTQVHFGGRVLDAQGAPLAGAEVLLVPCGRTLRTLGRQLVRGSRVHGALPEDIVRVTTGADGRFELGRLMVHRKPGEPNDAGQPSHPVIVVRAEGFADFGHTCLDVCTGSYDAGDLQLAPGAAVEGRVVDERGWPLGGARVAADVVSEQQDLPPQDVAAWLHAVATGEDGRFVLEGLPTGAVQLHLAAAGCTLQDTDAIGVQAGAVTSCGDLVLHSGGVVAGTVVDPTGQPRAGARVTSVWIALASRGEPSEVEQALAQLRDASPTGVTFTDEDGHFELGGLSGGNLSLLAALDGFEAALVHEIAPGRRDVVLPLRARAELDITVVDRANRTPVAGTLEARRPAASWAGPGDDPALQLLPVDGKPGSWRVLGAGPTGTELRFTAPGYARATELAPGVPPGESRDWPMELDRGGDLAGQVRDAQGRPLADAGLTLLRSPPKRPQPTGDCARSDAEGRFAIPNLPAGIYFVRGEACGCVTATSEPITLELGVTPPEAALVLQRAGAVAGRVLDPDGRPLSGRPVSAQGPSADGHAVTRSVRTDTAGRFALRDLKPGDWDLTAVPEALVHAVVEPDAVAEVELRVVRGCVLRGTVLADALGVPGADVTALKDGLPHRGVADERGCYELSLDPGDWQLQATTADGGWTTADVTLVPGELRKLDLTLPSGRLTVLAVSTDGTPAAGTALDLDWLPPGAAPEEIWKPVPCQLVTDANGLLVYSHLPEGDYHVKALGDAWLDAEPTAVTVGDEPRSLQLAVRPAAMLHGWVLTSAGLPAPDQTIIMVYLAGGRRECVARASVNGSDGSFSLGRLQSGRYLVTVRADWRQTYDPAEIRAERAVDLTEGSIAETTLIMR